MLTNLNSVVRIVIDHKLEGLGGPFFTVTFHLTPVYPQVMGEETPSSPPAGLVEQDVPDEISVKIEDADGDINAAIDKARLALAYRLNGLCSAVGQPSVASIDTGAHA